MKVNSETLKSALSLLAVSPFLLPRLTASTGYEIEIVAATFFLILSKNIFSPNVKTSSFYSAIFSLGCLLSLMIGLAIQAQYLNQKHVLFFVTLICFSFYRRNIFFARGLYAFSVASVGLAILMSLSPPSSFILPPSSYEVFGFERLSFLFNEPSHYSIFLALSFGIGMMLNKPAWTKFILLAGIILTFSFSGFIVVLGVYLLNQAGAWKNFKKLLRTVFLVSSTIAIITYFLYQADPESIVAVRVDQFLDGIESGFQYSSTGVRIASALIGFQFFSTSVINGDFLNLFFGVGFDNIQSIIFSYYNNFFFEMVDNDLVFNFISSLMLSGGVVGLVFYLGAIENIRKVNQIGRTKWLTLLLLLSLTHGYLYGPLAFIFIICAGYSIASPNFVDKANTLN